MPNFDDRRNQKPQASAAVGWDELLSEAGINDDAPTTARDYEDALMGREPVGQGDVSLIPLRYIQLDPQQARRAMPDDLREKWLSGAAPDDVFREWEMRALKDKPTVVTYWRSILAGDVGEVADLTLPREATTAISWLKLVALAGNILAHGLKQPVGVVADGDSYRLLFGERRFLAFALLVWQRHAEFERIPARIEATYDPLVQASENGQRQALNAIGVARALAVILIHQQAQQGNRVQGYKGAQPSWEWYTQAEGIRAAPGTGTAVAQALGLGSYAQVSQYRALLRLPAEVATLADVHNWTEGKLRGMIQKSGGQPLQLLRLARIEARIEKDQSELSPETFARKTILSWLRGKDVSLENASREEVVATRQAIDEAIQQLQEQRKRLR